MLSRRPTSYHFDYTVVLHSHPSAIKTFISLNCNQYSRSSPIRQGFLSIFYQNRYAFLCNYMSFVLFSRQFSYKLISCSRQLLLVNFHTDLLTSMEPGGNACLLIRVRLSDMHEFAQASMTADQNFHSKSGKSPASIANIRPTCKRGVETDIRLHAPSLTFVSYTAGFQMRGLYFPSTAARIHPKISQEITSPIPTVSIISGIGSSTPYA